MADYGIRGVYNPEQLEKDKIKFIYDRKRLMEESDDRQKAMKMADKAEKQYEAWREDRAKTKWQSNHVTLETFAVVETALAEIATQNIRPLILPRGKEDEPKAQIMSYVWDYAWECSDSDLGVYNILKDALIFGTGIGQEYYWKDQRLVSTAKLGKNGEVENNEASVTVYDDVYLEAVRFQDFYVDEKARGFTGPFGARDAIRRYVMDIEDFKLFFQGDIWNPLNNAKYVRPGGNIGYYEFFKPPTSNFDASREVEVLWYWAQKPKDRLIIVANDVLIVDSPNPYKHKQLPFVRCVDVKRPHRFYGKGEPEILESVHDESTTLRRMIIDRNHLDIDKMFFVSRSAALSDEDLVARPHGMIPTDDVNAAKPIEYGDIPRSTQLSLQNLEDDATISTGINPRAEALPQAGTATEAAILKESTLKRIGMKVWMMKKEFLIQLARIRVANILQYYPQPKLEAIIGSENEQMYKDQIADLNARGLLVTIQKKEYVKQYKQIRLQGAQLDTSSGQPQIQPTVGNAYDFFDLKPEYFVPANKGGYDIKFDATSNVEISKPLMQDKAMQLFDRFLQVAQLFPGSYDPVKLGDDLLKKFDKNPNDFKPQQAQPDAQAVFLQNQINLANMENQQMINGTSVPPTPYASPIHTRVHVEFMQGPQFQTSSDQAITKAFTDHVVGEMAAQGMRGQSPTAGGQQQPPQQNMPMQPGQGGQGGAFNGQINKPGGVQQAKTAVNSVIPNRITGQ